MNDFNSSISVLFNGGKSPNGLSAVLSGAAVAVAVAVDASWAMLFESVADEFVDASGTSEMVTLLAGVVVAASSSSNSCRQSGKQHQG
jgi:hypothetical protein